MNILKLNWDCFTSTSLSFYQLDFISIFGSSSLKKFLITVYFLKPHFYCNLQSVINVYHTYSHTQKKICLDVIVPVQIYNNHCLLSLNRIIFILPSKHIEPCKISICTHGPPSGAAYMPTDAVCQASLKSSSFLKPPHTRSQTIALRGLP